MIFIREVITILDIASKYEAELIKLFSDIIFDEKYKYFTGTCYRDRYKASDSTWNKHEFVSMHNGVVRGYFGYDIDRSSDNAYNLRIVNFYEPNIIFSKDLKQMIFDIFNKFKFRKINYSVYIGNPIEKSYDRLTEKYGGRIVGIYENEGKLIDGEYYDCKLYELRRENFLNNYKMIKE